jgi:catechol 2,3-dioxygenase-like lactoylglutathione lyase family enzyme
MKMTMSNPVYPVADVAASIAWYRRVLGFEPRVVNPPGDDVPVYAVLYRDTISIHLLRRDEAPHGLTSPVEAQFWIDGGLDELFAEVQRMGVEVVEEPSDRPWCHRDFIVADPDRNLVWVTMPLAPNVGRSR